MVDTVKSKEEAVEIAKVLDNHKGEDTIVIDVSEESSWTDFFVISTVNSQGHLKGVVRNVKQHLRERDLNILHRHKRMDEDGWELIDCGDIVIHIMDREMREFYELEKLWFNGEVIYSSSSYQSSKSSKSSPSA